MGQPLLPHHLLALEESVLAYARTQTGGIVLPDSGIAHLEWDPNLLSQGMVSINHLIVQFPSGQRVDTNDNGMINTFDFNQLSEVKVQLYLHLMRERHSKEIESDQTGERIRYGIYELVLSEKGSLQGSVASMKFGLFEKNLESQWVFDEEEQPPFVDVGHNPFFAPILDSLLTQLSKYEQRLKQQQVPYATQQRLEMKTRLCLRELFNLRRLLHNVKREVAFHPYFLYEAICSFNDMIALIAHDKHDIPSLHYTHDRPGTLFKGLQEDMAKRLDIQTDRYSSVQFEKKNQFYVIQRLPSEVFDVKRVYLIIQPIKRTHHEKIEGVKIGSLSRLPNIVNLALGGVQLKPCEHSVFNNNFSADAHVYEIQKDKEWMFIEEERGLGLSLQGGIRDVQAFIYWRC